MAGDEELEQRVDALENEVRDLSDRVHRSEHDAAAARVLAGGADRDVGEIGREIRTFRTQNTRVLSAMRSDLTDVRTDLTDVRADLTDVRTDVNDVRTDLNNLAERVDAGFAGVRGAIDATAAGQARIVDLLNHLIDRDASS